MSDSYRIERQFPCGNWGKVQVINPNRLDFLEIPSAIRKPRRRGPPPGPRQIIADYAALVFARWEAARPNETMRLIKEPGYVR